jgi:hypothetical protein
MKNYLVDTISSNNIELYNRNAIRLLINEYILIKTEANEEFSEKNLSSASKNKRFSIYL